MLRPNPTRTPGSGFLTLVSRVRPASSARRSYRRRFPESSKLQVRQIFGSTSDLVCASTSYCNELALANGAKGGGGKKIFLDNSPPPLMIINQSNNQFYLPGKCYKYFKYRMSTEDKFLFGTN